MIIAFYPGAGGNRFLRRMLNKEWMQPDRSYDKNNQEQQFTHRYLFEPIIGVRPGHVLTHCMNSQVIQQRFPEQPIVFINSNLQVSLQREWALHGHQRFQQQVKVGETSKLEHYLAIKDPNWPLINHADEINQLPEYIKQEVQNDYAKVNKAPQVPDAMAKLAQDTIAKINSAYEMIVWHQNYYKQYPADFSGAKQVIDIDIDQLDFCQVMRAELARYHSDIFQEVWTTIDKSN